MKFAIKTIGVLGVTLLLSGIFACDAIAQEEGAQRRKREKYLEYSQTINWSASPFDAEAHREKTEEKDDIATEDNWLSAAESRATTGSEHFPDKMVDDYLALMRMDQNQAGQAGLRRRNEQSVEKPSLLDMDISAELSGEKEVTPSGWGWLADSMLAERNANGLEPQMERTGHADSYRGARDERHAGSITDSLAPGSASGRDGRLASPVLPPGGAGAGSQAEREPGLDNAAARASSDATARSTTGTEDVLAIWERDMGLTGSMANDESAMPQTKKILEELTRSVIRPQEAAVGEAPSSSRRYLSGAAGGAPDSSLFSQRQAAEAAGRGSSTMGQTPSAFTPYESSYTRSGSSLERNAGTFSQDAYKRTYSSGAFDSDSRSPAGGTAFGQEPFGSTESPSSSLDSFRQMHRDSGSIRPFESGSSAGSR